jgi:alpha-beta hydrolase superfamily lysophospholipase
MHRSGPARKFDGDIHDYRQWFADLADVVALANAEYPDSPVHLVGHCFGANIALGAVLSGSVRADSIVMLTPGLYVLPGYSAWDKLRIGLSGVLAPHTTFGVPQDDSLFSRDPHVLQWIARDALGARHVTARTLMQIDRMRGEILSQLHSLELPTLVLEAARDRLSDNARNRATLGDLCLWRTFDAEHFLLAEPCVDQVIDTIVQWTLTKASPQGD